MVNRSTDSLYSVIDCPGKDVLVFGSEEGILNFTINTWAAISEEAIRNNGIFTVALSGGRTPVTLYTKLAEKGSLAWEKTHIFIVDERYVPSDHEDSNLRMIMHTLLNKIDIPEKNIHPILTISRNAEESAALYRDELISFFNLGKNEFPSFDLILLGIGEDGHTASLFPATTALDEKKHPAVAVPADKAGNERITITFPVINNARNVIFTSVGKKKAEVIKEVIQNENMLLPASKVNPASGRLYFLLDNKSASLLTKNLI